MYCGTYFIEISTDEQQNENIDDKLNPNQCWSWPSGCAGHASQTSAWYGHCVNTATCWDQALSAALWLKTMEHYMLSLFAVLSQHSEFKLCISSMHDLQCQTYNRHWNLDLCALFRCTFNNSIICKVHLCKTLKWLLCGKKSLL